MKELVDKIIIEIMRQLDGQVTDGRTINFDPLRFEEILNTRPRPEVEKLECAEAKIEEIIHWTRRSMGPLCSPIDDGLSYDLIGQKIKTHTAELLALLAPAPVTPEAWCRGITRR